MTSDVKNHPRFVGSIPRETVTLAVSPKRNAMARHGCLADEGADALDPRIAAEWLARLMEAEIPPKRLVLAGPGDPLATSGDTLDLLRQAHAAYPGLSLSITTTGLGLPGLVDDLAAAGVSEVTLLVDAVDQAEGESVYRWIRPGTRTLPLAQGVSMLLADQKECVSKLVAAGITVNVETRCIPGVNDQHLPSVARAMAGYGASGIRITTCPVEDKACDPDIVAAALAAIGDCMEILPEQPSPETPAPEQLIDQSRPYVAVATSDGIGVNAHLGQAHKLMIYGLEGGGVSFVGARETPEPGTDDRWNKLAAGISDCRAILAAHAGEIPRKTLAENGIRVFEAHGSIEGAVKKVYAGAKGMAAPSCDSGGEC